MSEQRKSNHGLSLRSALRLGLLACLVAGWQSVYAAADLPTLRTERYSVVNRLANHRSKYPFLANSNRLQELRQAEKSALLIPEVQVCYQAARSQALNRLQPAFPALGTVSMARPVLEDESFRVAAQASSPDHAARLRAYQGHLAGFATNALYVSDWCQTDMLLLLSCVDPKLNPSLEQARMVALKDITNGASAELAQSGLAACQLEADACSAILQLQELNRTIAKLEAGRPAAAPIDVVSRAFGRMQGARSAVRLDQRMVLFPATELLASTSEDALASALAYLDIVEARDSAQRAQDKSDRYSGQRLKGLGQFIGRHWMGLAIFALLPFAVIFLYKLATRIGTARATPIAPPAKPVAEEVPAVEEETTASAESSKPATPGPTAKECFAQGFIGTGMELLTAAVKNEPQEFSHRMELAEAHFLNSHNLQHAERVVQELLESPHFTPEQKEQARAKLREWQERKAVR